MKVALCSDERYPVQDTLQRELSARGHAVELFGALASGKDEPWAEAAERAALSIVRGECQQGVFSCWSGTGISMAANKVPGIRAGLCTDAGTVRAARLWNDANVLCLSNRLLSDDLAKELLAAWFEAVDPAVGAEGVAKLRAMEARYRAS